METAFIEILPFLKNFALGLVLLLVPIFLSLIILKKITSSVKENSKEIPIDQ